MTLEQKKSIIRKNPDYARVWPDVAATMQEELEHDRLTTPRPTVFPGQSRTICKHFGDDTGETVGCDTCKGSIVLKVFKCEVYGGCTLVKEINGLGCCKTCVAYEPLPPQPSEVKVVLPEIEQPKKPLPKPTPVLHAPKPGITRVNIRTPSTVVKPQQTQPQLARPLIWQYGVTTVPERFHTLLPRTLKSLAAGGFDQPRLFIDGVSYDAALTRDYHIELHLPMTYRDKRVGCHANWLLSMHELFLRNPAAHRYVIFQDDIICVKNLKQYLETIPYQELSFPKQRGMYFNLYTFRENHTKGIGNGKHPVGFHEAAPFDGAKGSKYHNKQQQCGRSATALVFSRDAVVALLCAPHMIKRCMDPARGGAGILVDGGIVEAMNQANYWEQVHNPSLIQHIGDESTIGHHKQSKALTFPKEGENFDALSLISRKPTLEQVSMVSASEVP